MNEKTSVLIPAHSATKKAPGQVFRVTALDRSEDDVRALIRDDELQTVACGIRPGLVPRHQLDAYLRRLEHRRLGLLDLQE